MQYSLHSNRARLLRGVLRKFDKALEMQVKDFFKQIATSLRLLVTLRPYRQAARRQRGDEAKISFQHTRNFGLRSRPRSAPDM